MTNEEKKEWYTALYGCYYERLDKNGEIEIIDPTTIRKIESNKPQGYYPKPEVDPSKVIYKAPIMIYEHKSKPEK